MKRIIPGDVSEQLKAIGIEDVMDSARKIGLSLTEDEGKPKAEDISEDKDELEEDKIDPLDAADPNHELFDAIMEIPWDEMDEETAAQNAEKLLEGLKEKNEISEDAPEELRNRAEEVVEFLIEAVAKKTRRARSASMGKMVSYKCPPGYTQVIKANGRPGCDKSARVAGGAGKLAQKRRAAKRWRKSGKGKMSAKKSARWSARRPSRREDVEISPFASELMGLMEDEDQHQSDSVRNEIVDRLGNILELLSEEFEDEAVTRVFEEAFEPVYASIESGRLDEDEMDEKEFMAEIRPVLQLVHKSLGKLNDEGDLGN